jgi:hypothetical protein
VSGEASGDSGLPHQASQGGEVRPDVGQEAFEAPALEGSIATFGGIACSVVEALPGRRTDGDIVYEADRAIGDTLAHVGDLSVGMVGGLKRALVGWVEGTVHGGDGCDALETSLITEPFVALAGRVEAIGCESVAERTKGTSSVQKSHNSIVLF